MMRTDLKVLDDIVTDQCPSINGMGNRYDKNMVNYIKRD